jgi:predicted transcriptional regulator
MTAREAEVLAYISARGGSVGAAELAEHFAITVCTVGVHCNRLREAGHVHAVGRGRTARWHIGAAEDVRARMLMQASSVWEYAERMA